MKRRHLLQAPALVFALSACAPTTPEAALPPTSRSPEPAPAAEEPEAPPPAPTEAEIAAQKLEEDRQKMRGAAQLELRRWTPELRAEATALTVKKYANLKDGVTAALAGHHRTPGNAERDAARHPLATLEFFGMKPTMTVLEYGPGEGWYTEVLAPVLSASGKLLLTSTDPKGPPSERSTFYAERLSLFLSKSPEAYGKVSSVSVNPAAPDLKLEGTVDLALVIRGAHGMVQNDSLGVWLDELYAALKPGGVLGVVQHRAGDQQLDADPKVVAKSGYLSESWLIAQAEAHGFKLAGKSEINANPKDTKDYAEGVWTLPPTLRLGEKDRAKYLEIGESDRMTLKFVKAKK